jgi:Tol biopolymer transport system component
MTRRYAILAALFLIIGAAARAADVALGLFADQCEIGAPSTVGAGSAEYDAGKNTYTVSGGGANTWLTADAFHYVWKRIPAGRDISLAATIHFAPATAGADPHRKAFLMIRQSLDNDSPYADACVHGNGLTAIQWRDTKADPTYETQSQVNGPARVRIEKRGDYLSMSFGSSEKDLQPAGGACKVRFSGEMYVGIGVCAHNAARIENAVFTDVAVNTLAAATSNRTTLISTLETIQVSSKDRKAVYVIAQPGLHRAEAPNWSADNMLYFNNRGRLFKIKADLPAATPPAAALAAPVAVDLGLLTNINNDHDISPDGKLLAVSDQSQGDRQSAIWVLPVAGAGIQSPRRITENVPSYFHGWSPDGKTLVFCGKGGSNFNIYTISIDGGPEQPFTEKRLTDTVGKDDGPEFTRDGRFIYFNSDRTGSMQIWRMKPDGSNQEQVTKNDFNNWFPHVSPNGRQMVFISYEKGVVDHPENKDVQLRLMNLRTGTVTVLAKLFGGQGTMNVRSWSPDGQFLAFMSYQIVPQ